MIPDHFERRSGGAKPVERWGLPRFPALALVLALGALAGCQQYDGQVGRSIAGQGMQGVQRELRLPVEQTRTYVAGDDRNKPVLPLIVGQYDGFRSDGLVRWTDFTQFGDSLLDIESVQLSLTGRGFVDSASAAEDGVLGATWDATLLRVDSWYNEDSVVYGHLADFQLTPLDTLQMGRGEASGRDTLLFDLGPATLRRWIEGDSAANGVLIRPDYDQASYLRSFVGLDLPTIDEVNRGRLPLLLVVCSFMEGEETFEDTLIRIEPDLATFLTDDTLDAVAQADDRLVLSEGYVRRMLFHSDMESLLRDRLGYDNPAANISINRAELVLHEDRSWEHRFGDSLRVTWQDVRSEWMDAAPEDTVLPGKLTTLAWRLEPDTNSVRINITPLSRQWVAFPDSNFGLWVRPEVEGRSVVRTVFHDITAAGPDTLLRPYLYVIYTDYGEQ